MSSDMNFDLLKLTGAELEYLKKKREKDKQKTLKIVSSLINTSVQDMRSSLDCAEATGEPFPTGLLQEAFREATRRGEKTRANILLSRIRRYEREGSTG